MHHIFLCFKSTIRVDVFGKCLKMFENVWKSKQIHTSTEPDSFFCTGSCQPVQPYTSQLSLLSFFMLPCSQQKQCVKHKSHNSSTCSDKGLMLETWALEACYSGQFTLST